MPRKPRVEFQVEVIVVSSPKAGVAAALNHGLRYCSSDLIARMDVDDVCAPERLLRQWQAMQEKESKDEYFVTTAEAENQNDSEDLLGNVAVLGTCSILFHKQPCHDAKQQTCKVVQTCVSSLPYESRISKLLPHGTSCGSEEGTTGSPKDNMDQNKKDARANGGRQEEYSVRPCLHPTLPGFSAWCMIFSCCISHPSVMFRKSSLVRVLSQNKREDSGNNVDNSAEASLPLSISSKHVSPYFELYRESKSTANVEDYDLWLRLTMQESHSIHVLPVMGVWHRKHPHSATASIGAEERRAQANKVAWNHIVRILAAYRALLDMSQDAFCQSEPSHQAVQDNYNPSVECVAVLRGPHHATTTSSDINNAAHLLLLLERAFLCLHANRSGKGLTPRETELIKMDCTARLAQLASYLIEQFGKSAIVGSSEGRIDGAWQLWCKRCPQHQMARLSLLCQSR